MLFVGTYENYKLDGKGRLSVPVKWRERLGRDFYMVAITVKGCKCITLYPVDEFEKHIARCSAAQRIKSMQLQRIFFAMQKNVHLMLREGSL